MQNPIRSEAEAFRLVVAAVVTFGLTAAASVWGGVWWGLGVFVVLAGAVSWFYLRAEPPPPPARIEPARPSPPGVRRILVIANETVGGTALRETIRQRSGGEASDVLVVAPALSTPLEHWTSAEDDARAAAQERLRASLARLRQAGIEARGEVGDADPLQAIEDALRTFGADELIVSTHPEGRSNWLERGVVEAARQRFAVPLTHVVVDVESEREEVR